MSHKSTTEEALPHIVVEAAYGRAMLSAHALELKLSTLLILRLGKAKINQIQRLPLGPLIERFVKEYRVDDELQEELDNMLYFRNNLAHRISDTFLGKALDQGWRHRVVVELLEIESYFRETNELLERYVDEWLHANGFTRKQLVSIVMSAYKGLASG